MERLFNRYLKGIRKLLHRRRSWMELENKKHHLENYESEKAKIMYSLICFKGVTAEELRGENFEAFLTSIKEARKIIMGMEAIDFKDKKRDEDNLMFELVTRSGQFLESILIVKSKRRYLEMNACRAKERLYNRVEFCDELNELVKGTRKKLHKRLVWLNGELRIKNCIPGYRLERSLTKDAWLALEYISPADLTEEGIDKLRSSVIKAQEFVKWMTLRFFGVGKTFNDEELLEKIFDRLGEILLLLEQADVCNILEKEDHSFPELNYFGWLKLKSLIVERFSILLNEMNINSSEQLIREMDGIKDVAIILDATLFSYANNRNDKSFNLEELRCSLSSIKQKVLAMKEMKMHESNEKSDSKLMNELFEGVQNQMKLFDEENKELGSPDREDETIRESPEALTRPEGKETTSAREKEQLDRTDKAIETREPTEEQIKDAHEELNNLALTDKDTK